MLAVATRNQWCQQINHDLNLKDYNYKVGHSLQIISLHEHGILQNICIKSFKSFK